MSPKLFNFRKHRKSKRNMMKAGTSKFTFDLIVIGAGSGGVRAARIAAKHGASVALIETSLQHGPEFYTAMVSLLC